ncbi:hypothetical protein Taro_005548 [Colocasia esculenta]|uniref:NAD-dependent epimerase/dehydratase domain-containing protein n=1 Tax=Colocasia esculenta TaxID=4460 RepID=A0A843TUV9_COLES|nr:hypothetical protein [Colocasia esculenta]
MVMEGKGKVVCVTGAGGFLASWLVKLLLSDGYRVHGTVRDPNDEKNTHLKTLENAEENLRLFKAELLDYGSLSAAIAGCEGVFHIACPVPSSKVTSPENEMVVPAIDGTLNVLKASSEAKVRRVVMVSSTGAVYVKPGWPEEDKIIDEEWWTDKEFCKQTENWYCFSKTIAEEKGLDYARESGLDLVRVCPCLILGPMLQPTLNASSSVLVRILKGVEDLTSHSLLDIVDVRDVASALLLLYDKAEATGRYICSSYTVKASDYIDMLESMYPNYKYPKAPTEVDRDYVLSAEKLKQLGWKYRTLEESTKDAVDHLIKAGLISEG